MKEARHKRAHTKKPVNYPHEISRIGKSLKKTDSWLPGAEWRREYVVTA